MAARPRGSGRAPRTGPARATAPAVAAGRRGRGESTKPRLTADSSIGRICGCGHAQAIRRGRAAARRRDAEAQRMTLPEQVEPTDTALDEPVAHASALRLTLASPLYRGA